MNLPKTVYILCVGTLINRAGSMVLPFLVLYLADHHGMTGHQATTTMGLFGVGSIVAALVGGWLADHLGRRIIMIASLVGSGAVLCVFAELRGTAILGAAVFLFALLTDMYRPAAQAMIADTVETDIRPQAYGLMYLAINLGFAISPILGGWLVMYSFKALFVVDALTTLAYAAIIFMLIKETRPARDSSAHSLHATVPSSDRRGFILFGWFCFGVLILAVVYSQAMVTLPLMLRSLQYSPTQYGRFMAINGVMIVCLQIPFTAMANRFDRSRVLFCAALIQGVGFGALAFVSSWSAIALTIVIWTSAEMLCAPLMPTIVSDLAPVHLRARYMGVFTMCYASAHAIGAPLGGHVLDSWGATTLWTSAWWVCVLGGIIYLVLGRRLQPTADSATP